MKSPHTPHCKDPACIQQFCCLPDWIQAFNLVSESIGQFNLRAAGAAGNRLCMVAPATRIPILLGADRTWGEFCHGCPFAVVRDFIDDTIAGSAVYTGSCPVIFVSPAFVEDIGDAVTTDRNIGGDHAGQRTGTARQYEKSFRDFLQGRGDFNRIDPGERGTAGDCR